MQLKQNHPQGLKVLSQGCKEQTLKIRTTQNTQNAKFPRSQPAGNYNIFQIAASIFELLNQFEYEPLRTIPFTGLTIDRTESASQTRGSVKLKVFSSLHSLRAGEFDYNITFCWCPY